MTNLEPDSAESTPNPVTRPRVRFGTISWGLIVGLGGLALLLLLLTPGARSQLVQWVLGLDAATVVQLVAVMCGAILLLLGVLALVRRRQLRKVQ